tara:strand:- start:1090 stop:1761 length:672 start_codon:yes stop_codon:yes gene_type:complete
MKARLFKADAIYKTWPKIYILTEDGLLYSEYLDYLKPSVDKQNFSFDSFSENDYSFGDYQKLSEIDEKTARKFRLVQQDNWVDSYLKNHNAGELGSYNEELAKRTKEELDQEESTPSKMHLEIVKTARYFITKGAYNGSPHLLIWTNDEDVYTMHKDIKTNSWVQLKYEGDDILELLKQLPGGNWKKEELIEVDYLKAKKSQKENWVDLYLGQLEWKGQDIEF